MNLTIIGAESLGVRSLCCLVRTPDRRIVIDPGLALGYMRHHLLPHPLQIAVGRVIRAQIIAALQEATDVVISHFHGDHIPLINANPYQLSLSDVPLQMGMLRCWSASGTDLSPDMQPRLTALSEVFGSNMCSAEGLLAGPLSFSEPVPHGSPDSSLGSVMMTRVEYAGHVFVHASDIQLLDEHAIDRIIAWNPDIVLAGGPPLYLSQLTAKERESAWNNAVRLLGCANTVILDHHLMRCEQGAAWLDELAHVTGKRPCCAADYMGHPRHLLEAARQDLYQQMPVPPEWHERYERGETTVQTYFEHLAPHTAG